MAKERTMLRTRAIVITANIYIVVCGQHRYLAPKEVSAINVQLKAT